MQRETAGVTHGTLIALPPCMSTILIIVLVVLLLGGGGLYMGRR